MTNATKCLYFLIDEDATPFYVGKGELTRPNDHLKESRLKETKKPRNKHKIHKIRKTQRALGEVPIVIAAEGLTDAQSNEMEIAFIAAIGRADLGLGPLTNMTDGGEGLVNEGSKAKATRLANSIARRKDIDVIKRQREGCVAAWTDPEMREYRIAGMKKAWRRSEVRENHAKGKSDPGYQKMHSERTRYALADPEVKERQRVNTKKALADPGVKAKLVEAHKRNWANPEERSKRIAAIRKARAHWAANLTEADRLRYAEIAKVGWATRRANQLKQGSNS